MDRLDPSAADGLSRSGGAGGRPGQGFHRLGDAKGGVGFGAPQLRSAKAVAVTWA